MTGEQKRAGPLAHIKVLDLSRIVAGPWASQVLADLGADVVKIERPEVGDDTRSWGPPFLKDSIGKPSSNSGYFQSVNRGKRSVTVDLSQRQGQELVRKLAKDCDVLIENFKVGSLRRFGLDYDSLKTEHPALIYASITGFGQDGPRAKQPAYDFMIQAMGGLMSVTGERDDNPGGGPQKVGVPIVDLMTGMYAAVAVLAALSRREQTGDGDYIDLALLDVQTAFLANQAMNYLLTGETPERHGNRHPNIQPQDVFQCRDGHIAIAVGNDRQFERFAEILGCEKILTDERFHSNASRLANVDYLHQLVNAALLADDVEYWVEKLSSVGVPCSPINSIPGLLKDPQVKHREMMREIEHPEAGRVPQIVSPLRFRNAPLTFDKAPPTLSEHTEEVLREAGLKEETINSLRKKNVI